jgi:hypothetical protein
LLRSSIYFRGPDFDDPAMAKALRRELLVRGIRLSVQHGFTERTGLHYVSVDLCHIEDSARHMKSLVSKLETVCRSWKKMQAQFTGECSDRTLAITGTNGHEHHDFVRTLRFEPELIVVCSENGVRIELQVCPCGDAE